MSESNDVINLHSAVVSTGANSVEFCETCGCPVVNAAGSMDRHKRRIHIPSSAAKAGINVARWEREW